MDYMDAEVDGKPGLAGFSTPYQPYNPSRFNLPNVQGVPNFVNANDRNYLPKTNVDRHVFDPTSLPAIDLRDPYCRVLDANTNNYVPRRYPDPSCVRTSFPSASLRQAEMNGRTTALNRKAPARMPVTGTNDTGLIVTMF